MTSTGFVNTEGARPSASQRWDLLREPITELRARASGGEQPLSSLQEAMRHAVIPFGKLARPTLMFAAHSAVGGDPNRIVSAALGVEYCHVGSLVHDDIIDHDMVRRGRPSVVGRYGTPTAIVTGDSLIFESFSWVYDCTRSGIPEDLVARAVAALATAGSELCRGQTLEGDMVADSSFDLRTYVSMASGKTAALFAAACRIGAILADVSTTVENALADFGLAFGIAFQMSDDLLAYRDTDGSSGKNPMSDIINGRVTLPLLTALQQVPPGTAEHEALVRAQREAAAGTEPTVDPVDVHAILGEPGNVHTSERVLASYIERAETALHGVRHCPERDLMLQMLSESACRIA